MAEYFDIVDEQDRVVGRASRQEAHARGLLHRAVHILVKGSDGRIFLQKRSLLKDTAKGLWDSSCSGHVDSGEDYDTAATRELQEELGLSGAHPRRLLRIEACQATGWEFVWVYALRSDGPFVLPPEEIECGAWMTPEQIDQSVSAQAHLYAKSFLHIWNLCRTLI